MYTFSCKYIFLIDYVIPHGLNVTHNNFMKYIQSIYDHIYVNTKKTSKDDTTSFSSLDAWNKSSEHEKRSFSVKNETCLA